jgi:Tfp pilus assembly protein PilE
MLASPRCRGTTLIELLTVMIVMAALFAITLGMVRASKQRANLARARGELAAIGQALESYKNYYGDYPQTGNAAPATPVVTATIAQSQAQAQLLNALIGVYGPTNFSTRINGPEFIEASKLTLEVALTAQTATTFGVAQGTPPIKQPVQNSLVDPWGYRYQYFYKPAPAPGRPPTNTWRAPSYILYSVGPDGAHTAPNTTTGLFNGTTQTTGNNADNVFANP